MSASSSPVAKKDSSSSEETLVEKRRRRVLGEDYNSNSTFIKSNTNPLPREITNRVRSQDKANITHDPSRKKSYEAIKKEKKDKDETSAEEEEKPNIPMWAIYIFLAILVIGAFVGIFGRGSL